MDILERSTKINVDGKLLPHSIRSCHVLDPHRIEYNVRYLGQLVSVDVFEDCKKQRDMFDDQLIIANVDSIQYIEGVLDEKEDARAEEFLGCSSEDKR